MYEAIIEEFDKFKSDCEKGLSRDKSNNYFDSMYFEDEYSGREISEAQHRLQGMISDFLIGEGVSVNEEGATYRVYYDWCVHIVHKDFDEELKERSEGLEEKRVVAKKRREAAVPMTEVNIKKAINILNAYEYSTKLELSEGVSNDITSHITVADFMEMKAIAIEALENQL